MRRPALIFDFGNVLAFFDYARACARFGARLGLSGSEILQRALDAGLTPLVERYECGALTSEDFSRSFTEILGIEIGHEAFAAAWSDIFWLNEPVARLAHALKERGHTLILGSNTNALHAAQFRRQFAEALAPFDRLVLSFEIGHMKPSAAFYRACVAAAETGPGDCIFIDDRPENVEGARAAGLVGIPYRDDADLIARLVDLGLTGLDSSLSAS